MRKFGHNTRVDDINRFRARGLNAHHFIDIVKREGDPHTTTGFEKLQFLTYGSPVIAYMFHQLDQYVLPQTSTGKPRKLLVTEVIVLTACFGKRPAKLLTLRLSNYIPPIPEPVESLKAC